MNHLYILYTSADVHKQKNNKTKEKETSKATEPHHIHYNKLIKEQYNKAENIILDNFQKPFSITEFINKLKDRYYGNVEKNGKIDPFKTEESGH